MGYILRVRNLVRRCVEVFVENRKVLGYFFLNKK